MNEKPRTIALIVAAGRGERAGGGMPKQYRRVAGKSLIAHAVERFRSHTAIDDVIAVIGDGQRDMLEAAMSGVCAPVSVTGGASRQQSVRAGLEHIRATGSAARVLIHDAARPFLAAAVIDRLLLALEDAPGAIPVLPVVDTLVRGNKAMDEAVPRDQLWRVQTPQAFRFDDIYAAHRNWRGENDATDDAQLLRAQGGEIAIVEGDSMLEKLTLPADFDLAEARMANALRTCIGMGYDVHRLVPGKPLWLCGLEIAHSHGLSGHSDADVAIHAVVDAVLGALAEGDIGMHFPPSDPKWKGAPSSSFLEFARERVEARGGRIVHVDVTIICEAPKIGPHRDNMRSRLAELLRIDTGSISVKATTTEGLGFAGRREGIAAQAVATLALPLA